MSDESSKAYQATSPATLQDQIMDSRVPKTEREWWAKREIERLQDERNNAFEIWKKFHQDTLAAFIRNEYEPLRDKRDALQALLNEFLAHAIALESGEYLLKVDRGLIYQAHLTVRESPLP